MQFYSAAKNGGENYLLFEEAKPFHRCGVPCRICIPCIAGLTKVIFNVCVPY